MNNNTKKQPNTTIDSDQVRENPRPEESRAELPHQPSDIKPEDIHEEAQEPPEVPVTKADHAHLKEEEKVPRPDAVYKDPDLVKQAEKHPLPNIIEKGANKTPPVLGQKLNKAPHPKKKGANTNRLKQLLKKADQEKDKRVELRLKAIIEYARISELITNNDVEALTGVSDTQATRYLNKLVRQGKLVRYGKYRHTYYKHISKYK